MSIKQTTNMVRVLLLLVTATAVSASPAAGQTRLFEASRAIADVSTYTSVYDCMAAVDRVRKALEVEEFRTTGVWADTMPYDPDTRMRPWPPAVGETARKCLLATAEDAASAPLGAWKLVANLYLHAGMEDSARAVVERRLDAVEPDSAQELKALFTELLFLYNGEGARWTEIRPTRLALADEIVLSYVGKLSDPIDRFVVYRQMAITGKADLTDDSEAGVRTRRIVTLLKAQLDSLTDGELQRWAEENGAVGVSGAEMRKRIEALGATYFGRNAMLDSLRVSTEAYSKIVRETETAAWGQPPESYSYPIGQRAPRLEGDIWLGCEQDPCEAYPRPGRVSLVAFHTPEVAATRKNEPILPSLVSPEVGCAVRAVPLRRLQERFPELDIIIVTRTTGRYAYVKDGTTPEREAELLLECFKSHGLERVVVTMTKTSGWRLPEPDGRWVGQPTANWTNYSFGGIWRDADRSRQGSDLLVDQDGYVIHTGAGLARGGAGAGWQEEWFAEIIEILLEREKAKT